MRNRAIYRAVTGPRLRSAAAAALSGLLAALAFPPSVLWPLAFIALLPLLRELDRGRGFGAALLAGLVYHTITVSWIGANTDPPPLLARLSAGGAIVWLSTLWGLTGLAAQRLRRHLGPRALWFFPALMVALDWLVEGTEMGFPWTLLGATQVNDPLLRPLAALGGMHAVTLALLTANVLLYRLWRPTGPRRPLWIGVALWLAAVPALGLLARGDVADTGREVELLLVQGNVDPVEKWSLPWMDTVAKHLELTRGALEAGARPQLVIWPETAVPTRLRQRPHLVGLLADFCRGSGAALLTGANDAEDDGDGRRRPYNGSFLVTGGGLADMYRKIRLVPFGERVPGQRFIPALGAINMGQAEFAPGTSLRAGRLPLSQGDTLRFAWSICFEGNFAALARAMVRDGAELLVNQTNDAWFGTGRELDQHLAIARLRAVETGRWLVRACNNGYSAAVAPDGRVVQLLPKGREGALSMRVPLRRGSTFYLRFGDLLPRLCLLLAAWGAVLAVAAGGARAFVASPGPMP